MKKRRIKVVGVEPPKRHAVEVEAAPAAPEYRVTFTADMLDQEDLKRRMAASLFRQLFSGSPAEDVLHREGVIDENGEYLPLRRR